jgi:hypothetical protein
LYGEVGKLGAQAVGVLGLVVALTIGSLAAAPSRRVARAAVDSVVLVWNEEALESVRKLPPAPR